MEPNCVIKLPCFGIKIELDGRLDGTKDESGWLFGNIESDLKQVCPYCNNPECEMECSGFMEEMSDRDADAQKEKEQEAINFQKCRMVENAIESLILAHVMAGVNVESSEYLNGLKTACDAIVNHI